MKNQREIAGHPVGLFVLFFTEMWERFSYYGMRALLVYYMTKYLFLAGHVEQVWGYGAIKAALEWTFGPMSVQALSSQIYGLYTGLVYFTPLLGGIVADRWLGQRKTVVVGGMIMAVGQFLLMMPSLFYPGLFLLIVGNGAFKPNISTQVGALYPKGDARRDRAFNIFYVGINTGAFLAPLVCGTLGETVGWHWGFGSAGVGMIVGLCLYLWGQRYLAPDNVMQQKEKAKAAPVATKPFTREEKSRIFALVLLCALNVPFWAVYEQQGNTLALWADGNTDRHVFAFLGIGWEMPATWFQAVNPFFIAALTPFINRLWLYQSKRGTESTSVGKMAVGCFLLAISFLIMIGAARAYDGGGLASMWWLLGCTFLLTYGEIYMSPVGLSLVTKISPARVVSMMMGFWFLSSFAGNYLCGYLGTFWERMSHGNFFLLMAGLSLLTGVAMLALFVPLKRAIGDENEPGTAPENEISPAPAE